MTLANEAHHLAHGMSLASEVDTPIATNTVLSNRFLECYDIPTNENSENSEDQYSPSSYFPYERHKVREDFRRFSDTLFNNGTDLGRARKNFLSVGVSTEMQSLRGNPHALAYMSLINSFLGLPPPQQIVSTEDARECDSFVSSLVTPAVAVLGVGLSSLWANGPQPRNRTTLQSNLNTGKTSEVLQNVDRRKLCLGLCTTFGSAYFSNRLTSNFSTAYCDGIHLDDASPSERIPSPGNGHWVPIIESSFLVDRSIALQVTEDCFSYDIPPDSPKITQDVDL